MNISDFILNHAIFNQKLSEAVLSKNKEEVNRIIHNDYADELTDVFVNGSLEFDIEELNKKYIFELANDDFNWAL